MDTMRKIGCLILKDSLGKLEVNCKAESKSVLPLDSYTELHSYTPLVRLRQSRQTRRMVFLSCPVA